MPALQKTLAAVSVGAIATLGSAGAAFAAGTPATLAQIQAKAQAAVTARVDSMATAGQEISAKKDLTAADATTISNLFASDTSGLQALGAKIAADTTVTQARADYKSIFTAYRVYVVAIPQAHLAAADDVLVTGALPHLTDAQQRLQGLLAGADSAANTPAVQAAMTDLATQLQTLSGANGLDTQVLAVTPAAWNADQQVMAPFHQTVTSAWDAVRTARSDISTVVSAIRSTHGQSSTPGGAPASPATGTNG